MNSNIAYFKGSIYPDRTFSIGYVGKKKKRLADSHYDKDEENQHDYYDYEYLDYGRKYKATHRFFSKSQMPSRFINREELSQPLKPKKRYGLQGITQKGKKTTSNCALLLQQKFGKRRLGFVTCTLPGYFSEVLKAIASEWSEIVRRFYQQVRRDLKSQNAPLEYVGVTEIQEKRWRKSQDVALHLHFAYVAKPASGKGFYISANRFREIWKKQIDRILSKHGLLHGCNDKSFAASIDCQSIKKSVAGYLGKYISKGCAVVEKVIEKGLQDCLPSQWWTASMQLKQRLKNKILNINKNLAKDFMYAIESLVENKIVETHCDVWCEWDGIDLRIGISGKLTEVGYYMLAKQLSRDYERWLVV